MNEAFRDLQFPLAGMDVTRAFGDDVPRPGPDGTFVFASRFGVNVKSFESDKQRARGGSRAGLIRYIPQALPGEPQCFDQIVSVEEEE